MVNKGWRLLLTHANILGTTKEHTENDKKKKKNSCGGSERAAFSPTLPCSCVRSQPQTTSVGLRKHKTTTGKTKQTKTQTQLLPGPPTRADSCRATLWEPFVPLTSAPSVRNRTHVLPSEPCPHQKKKKKLGFWGCHGDHDSSLRGACCRRWRTGFYWCSYKILINAN